MMEHLNMKKKKPRSTPKNMQSNSNQIDQVVINIEYWGKESPPMYENFNEQEYIEWED
jgi:hypothetical protein